MKCPTAGCGNSRPVGAKKIYCDPCRASMARTAKRQEADPGYIAMRKGALTRQADRLGHVRHRTDEIPLTKGARR
jgi:hypothetical protein